MVTFLSEQPHEPTKKETQISFYLTQTALFLESPGNRKSSMSFPYNLPYKDLGLTEPMYQFRWRSAEQGK